MSRGPGLAAAALAATLAATTDAGAHQLGMSRGDYTLEGAVLSAEITLAREEVLALAPELDADHDGALREEEAERGRAALQRALVDRLAVAADGAPCPGSAGATKLVEQDGVLVTATFRCTAPPRRLALSFPVASLAYGHRHVAHIVAGATVDEVLFARRPTVEIDIGGAAGHEAGATPPRSASSVAGGFFVSGIEHILTGIDHLAFLFGVILLGGRLRTILGMITAFTVAHSITLALAGLGIWAPSPSFVEPAIALSVAYVGIENWFVKVPERRWRITFPFGLLHGFGFAGALGSIGMPRPQVPLALLTFNLGVETGQIAALAAVLPLVLWARKHHGFRTTGVRILSSAVALAGIGWFVARTVG